MPFVLLAGVTVNEAPLQTVVDIPEITGVGLMVTVTLNVLPVQLPDSGVTV
jgi:hypothetical protein